MHLGPIPPDSSDKRPVNKSSDVSGANDPEPGSSIKDKDFASRVFKKRRKSGKLKLTRTSSSGSFYPRVSRHINSFRIKNPSLEGAGTLAWSSYIPNNILRSNDREKIQKLASKFDQMALSVSPFGAQLDAHLKRFMVSLIFEFDLLTKNLPYSNTSLLRAKSPSAHQAFYQISDGLRSFSKSLEKLEGFEQQKSKLRNFIKRKAAEMSTLVNKVNYHINSNPNLHPDPKVNLAPFNHDYDLSSDSSSLKFLTKSISRFGDLSVPNGRQKMFSFKYAFQRIRNTFKDYLEVVHPDFSENPLFAFLDYYLSDSNSAIDELKLREYSDSLVQIFYNLFDGARAKKTGAQEPLDFSQISVLDLERFIDEVKTILEESHIDARLPSTDSFLNHNKTIAENLFDFAASLRSSLHSSNSVDARYFRDLPFREAEDVEAFNKKQFETIYTYGSDTFEVISNNLYADLSTLFKDIGFAKLPKDFSSDLRRDKLSFINDLLKSLTSSSFSSDSAKRFLKVFNKNPHKNFKSLESFAREVEKGLRDLVPRNHSDKLDHSLRISKKLYGGPKLALKTLSNFVSEVYRRREMEADKSLPKDGLTHEERITVIKSIAEPLAKFNNEKLKSNGLDFEAAVPQGLDDLVLFLKEMESDSIPVKGDKPQENKGLKEKSVDEIAFMVNESRDSTLMDGSSQLIKTVRVFDLSDSLDLAEAVKTSLESTDAGLRFLGQVSQDLDSFDIENAYGTDFYADLIRALNSLGKVTV